RVRRVEEAMSCDGLSNAAIGAASLDSGDAVGQVDRQHLVHAREAKHDRIFERQSASRERGASPARDDLDVIVMAEAEDLADLLGRSRQRAQTREANKRGTRR